MLCYEKGFLNFFMKNSVDQVSPNISSRGPCVDFFGPPRAKAKNIVCEKQLIK